MHGATLSHIRGEKMIGPELYRVHMKQAKLAKAERAYWQKRRKEEAERYYEIVGRKPEGRKDDTEQHRV
jgi:hypothetical protein